VIDEAVKNIANLVLSKNGSVVITADHGNAEEMINRETGEMDTEHSVNPVPFIWVGGGHNVVLKNGALRDVAPTLLKIMSIKQPKEMTGKALF
jgi:2,3-bisphosphoglycerate-independent phosphoglycerate mutase